MWDPETHRKRRQDRQTYSLLVIGLGMIIMAILIALVMILPR